MIPLAQIPSVHSQDSLCEWFAFGGLDQLGPIDRSLSWTWNFLSVFLRKICADGHIVAGCLQSLLFWILHALSLSVQCLYSQPSTMILSSSPIPKHWSEDSLTTSTLLSFFRKLRIGLLTTLVTWLPVSARCWFLSSKKVDSRVDQCPSKVWCSKLG
jgi:hypothetical protein